MVTLITFFTFFVFGMWKESWRNSIKQWSYLSLVKFRHLRFEKPTRYFFPRDFPFRNPFFKQANYFSLASAFSGSILNLLMDRGNLAVKM